MTVPSIPLDQTKGPLQLAALATALALSDIFIAARPGPNNTAQGLQVTYQQLHDALLGNFDPAHGVTDTQLNQVVQTLTQSIANSVAISSIVDNLTSILIDSPLSANQGRVLKSFFDSLSIAVAAKLNISDIINNLTTSDATKALSATQGVVLQASIDNITQVLSGKITQSELDAAIANIIGAAPEALNQLYELANALGNDPNFSTTILTQLGQKLSGSDVVDNLLSQVTDKPLSAKQGYVIKGLIDALNLALQGKLDISAYNDRFKGTYTSLVELQTTHPTSSSGDTALVDPGNGDPAIQYIWSNITGWTAGSSPSATNSDQITEGTSNLFFTTVRAVAAAATAFVRFDQVQSLNPTQLANVYATLQINQALATITGTPPAVLNTLEKLATSINNDPAFYTTITDALATKVAIGDIINSLLSLETNKPLSAAQGGILKGLIDAANLVIDGKATPADITSAISQHLAANDPHGDRAYADTIVQQLAMIVNGKLDISAYNDRYKGTYTNPTDLRTAYPVGQLGWTAVVDPGAGQPARQWLWDATEADWVQGSDISPATTDQLQEGASKLYFTVARAIAAGAGVFLRFDQGQSLSQLDIDTALTNLKMNRQMYIISALDSPFSPPVRSTVYVDASSGPITVNLPTTHRPDEGVDFYPIAGDYQVNPITLTSSEPIDSVVEDVLVDQTNLAFQTRWIDAPHGHILIKL